MKRPLVIAINALLALIILGTVLATWMPAIYSCHWVRVHLLQSDHEQPGK